MTDDETDYDSELTRHLAAAKLKVTGYLNRGIYETLPPSPLQTDLELNESINRCILELAGYYFESKGAVELDIISSILDAFVGDYRLSSFS